MADGKATGVRGVTWLLVVVLIAVTAAVLYTLAPRETTPRVGLLTSDRDPYWDRMIAGAESAAATYGVELLVERPDGTVESQSAAIRDFEKAGLDGLAISPLDASRQAVALRQVAQSMDLVTIDNDCAVANRVCFVGADNYVAGRRCGELVKEALPDGGRVAIVMGLATKENALLRRQGIIDELLDRPYDSERETEPIDAAVNGERYTVAITVVDAIDPQQTEERVAAALRDDPTIDCVIGILAYSTPAALRAIAASERDDITVIGFDDDPELLDALSDGRAFAALVQDQYHYGYYAVRLLAEMSRGSKNTIPMTERVHFPPFAVTRENVATFRAGREREATAAEG